jgi:hypothetical protein
MYPRTCSPKDVVLAEKTEDEMLFFSDAQRLRMIIPSGNLNAVKASIPEGILHALLIFIEPFDILNSK